MTTVVILILGFGAILIISALETDPSTGNSVSVLQTISDVWNNKVSFAQPSSSTPGSASTPSPSPVTGPSRGQPNPGGGTSHYAALHSTAAAYWIQQRQSKGYGLGA